MDEITTAIAGLTRRLHAYRVFNKGNDMALEIKGLKGKALQAGGVFDRLNRAYDKLIETGGAHATDVEGLPAQIEDMADDLTFMVQTLGNSVNGSGESEKGKESPAEKQVIAAAGDLGNAADVFSEVAQEPTTFPREEV